MIILIGESGSGKTTVLNELEKRGIKKVINHTTRKPRPGEKELGEYKFITKEEFENLWKEGKLLQRAEFNGEYYGTLEGSNENSAVISIVDSVKDIKRKIKNTITFYITVPEEVRVERMRLRGETEESIKKRIEIDKEKFKKAKEVSDYVIENINLEDTVNEILKYSYKLPRVLAVHDVSCYGKCALTTAIPVISSLGVEVCPMPTAVFSTNTSMKGFKYEDLTHTMDDFIEHWKTLDLKFDAIYSGFLGSKEQIGYIKKAVKEFNIEKIIIDPVMGDNGEKYVTYTKEMCEEMKTLVAIADVVTPNLTEACILTNEQYGNNNIEKLAEKIRALGAKNVVITGIEKNGKLYNCILTNEGYFEREIDLLPFRMHGTGDLFGSVLVGMIMRNKRLIDSVDKAAEFVYNVMEYSKNIEGFQHRGPCFEPLLGGI